MTTETDTHTLAGWSVLPGGTHISLAFAAAGSDPSRIVLRADVLGGLLMALPRMLQAALRERLPSHDLRISWPLGP